MEKVVLVDGNNLLFRSYYATAYSGNLMRNSKGFPTNGLYGLVNMLNKIIKEENPKYMLVAFDKGKTFRHDKYKEYKDGRIKTPEDLLMQFKVAKELVPLMGIKCFEIDNYEADDIIGTYSKIISNDDKYEGLIVSSDKDLLQLINFNINVKLLKSKDYIMMDENTFKETYGIDPIKMIDLKGLMGDSSDNIPGVKGIGEKTALKLLQKYDSVEGVYENIEDITGSTKQKLIDGKESAYMSKDIATIYKDVPVTYKLEDLKYIGKQAGLNEKYEELEFYSFLKNEKKVEIKNNIKPRILDSLDNVKFKDKISVFIEVDNSNYHKGEILGAGIYDGENGYYIKKDLIKELKLDGYEKYTYDVKKNIVSLNKLGINFDNCTFDLMIASYILNYNVKDDISYLASELDYTFTPYDLLLKDKEIDKKLETELVQKAKFIYEVKDKLIDEMKEEKSYDLFKDIEMKLAYVLSSMEIEGIRVNEKELDKMSIKFKEKIDNLTKEIYELSNVEFNIQSPKQLSDILFNKLLIPYPKKNPKSYSTSREILDKIKDIHPIVNKIIDATLLYSPTTFTLIYISENCLSFFNSFSIYSAKSTSSNETGLRLYTKFLSSSITSLRVLAITSNSNLALVESTLITFEHISHL